MRLRQHGTGDIQQAVSSSRGDFLGHPGVRTSTDYHNLERPDLSRRVLRLAAQVRLGMRKRSQQHSSEVENYKRNAATEKEVIIIILHRSSFLSVFLPCLSSFAKHGL